MLEVWVLLVVRCQWSVVSWSLVFGFWFGGVGFGFSVLLASFGVISGNRVDNSELQNDSHAAEPQPNGS